jgi:4-diphosphocytidyl-2-C-methyl-D-erythritol kinase
MASRLIVWQKESKVSYGSKVKILSPAKLNLYLNITGRYSKRFNRIESVVERISLCDQLTITSTKDPAITIECNDGTLANGNNLCVRAAGLLKSKFRLKCGFHINLLKIIPVGAGLGGGSSNAASTLLGINSLLNLRLSRQELYKLGARLGSDVNFFISESPYAVMAGRGEKITPFNGQKLRHLVVWPGVSLATKLVYKNTQYKLTKFLSNANIMRYALKIGDIELLKNASYNVLEKTALSLCQELTTVKSYFSRLGISFNVTGSGSALYAFSYSNSLYKKLAKDLPRKWSFFAAGTF